MTKEQLEDFGRSLEETLYGICLSKNAVQGKMGQSLDLDHKWEKELGEPYIKDAVYELAAYPDAALGWACFLGMGVSSRWDLDYNRFKADDYAFFLGSRGWDDMDEHILRDILHSPLNSPKTAFIQDVVASCAVAALDAMRKSGVESGTADAYFIFVEACRILFRIGCAIELCDLGYRMTPLV